MKNLGVVLKILAALVAIAGMVYVIVTYGDKIAEGVKSAVAYVKRKFFRRDEDCFEDLAGLDATMADFED